MESTAAAMEEDWFSDILAFPSLFLGKMEKQMINEKQCFAICTLAEYMAHYASHWWNNWFKQELKSSSAARVGIELVKGSRKGLHLLQICAAKDSTVVWTILRGAGPFREVIEDVRRYAQIMNRLFGSCSIVEKREIAEQLKHKVEFDCRVLHTSLGYACRLDRITILEGLKSSNNNGHGTYGCVMRENLCELPVAVKVFHNKVSCEDELNIFTKFLETDYPSHVVGILGCSDTRIVLELMDKNLKMLIQKEDGPSLPLSESIGLPLSESIDIMIQIAEGMRFLHGHDVIYRDLKPANVLIQVREGQSLVVIADFGVSKEQFQTELANTSYKGTMLYMAPEMMEEGLTCKYTRKVDVHSFGMVCWEILTGKQTDLDPIQLKNGKRPPLPENIPISLGKLIQRCWDQEANKRPKFEEICDELWLVKEKCLTGCITEDVEAALLDDKTELSFSIAGLNCLRVENAEFVSLHGSSHLDGWTGRPVHRRNLTGNSPLNGILPESPPSALNANKNKSSINKTKPKNDDEDLMEAESAKSKFAWQWPWQWPWQRQKLSKKPLEVHPPDSEEETSDVLLENARKCLGVDHVNHYNFAVCGASGVGKSTFINSFLQLKAQGAAVGVTETNNDITSYTNPKFPNVKFWDFPGAGTPRHPAATYFKDKFLYAFECILILISDRLQEIDVQLVVEATKWKKEIAIVQTKADQSLSNMVYYMGASGIKMSEIALKFREEVKTDVYSHKNVPAEILILIICSRMYDEDKNWYKHEEDDSLKQMDEQLLLALILKSCGVGK